MSLAKVLVVEDEDDLREAIAMTLEACGYEVKCASNGREALELLATEMADVILLDMRMPVMNGWEFATRFRDRYGRLTAIIVLTAAADARRCAEDIGAEDWIAKPFDLDALIGKISQRAGAHQLG